MMKWTKLFAALLFFYTLSAAVHAGTSDSCRTLRVAETAWTDNSAANTLLAELLRPLGYTVKIVQLSVPITFSSLADGQIDLFLGAWLPVLSQTLQPYLEAHTIQNAGTLVRHVRSTLAVPEYVHQAGVNSIEDLHLHSAAFKNKIFGIEAGADGNRVIQKIITAHHFSLGNWTLKESSEQGMLTEVNRAIQDREWIVFLGWEPHPMNQQFSLYYLNGTDAYFGKNEGRGSIQILTHKDFATHCPEISKFLKNFTLDLETMNTLMFLIQTQKSNPQQLIHTWLAEHLNKARPWLAGVRSINGQIAFSELKKSFELKQSTSKYPHFVIPKIPLGNWAQYSVRTLTAQFQPALHLFSTSVTILIEACIELLLWFYPWALIGLTLVLCWILNRNLKGVGFVAAALLLVWNQGYWIEMIETLVLVLTATLIAVSVGVPFGIVCAHSKTLNRLLQPILDFMQTIPTFVYLIPTLMLFGLGISPALVSTMIFILPSTIRLTLHGIQNVPQDLLETAEALGATRWQRIWYIELPHAFSTIRVSISQAMMLSLSMVVVGALVGADGLGKPVVQALSTVNIAQGFEAGLIIVLIAMVFNQMLGVRN